MSWYVYSEGQIDSNWEHLASVKQTASQLAVPRVTPGYAENKETFMRRWANAQAAALRAGWEGDFSEGPVVFWLPFPNGQTFIYGFVFKQRNNGTTFVISPCELPWLNNLVHEPKPQPPAPPVSVLGDALDN